MCSVFLARGQRLPAVPDQELQNWFSTQPQIFVFNLLGKIKQKKQKADKPVSQNVSPLSKMLSINFNETNCFNPNSKRSLVIYLNLPLFCSDKLTELLPTPPFHDISIPATVSPPGVSHAINKCDTNAESGFGLKYPPNVVLSC